MTTAIVVEATPDGPRAGLSDIAIASTEPTDITVNVDYSSLNYKDGLALAGSPGVARRLPLVPGIDVVGTVTADPTDRFTEGDLVLVNGAGLGETRNGGYAETAIVDATAAIRVPAAFTARQAAAIGTAGFTAALSLLALDDGGVTPDGGDVLVTGATGGVGSIATLLLAARGYAVTASTGRIDGYGDYLHGLGATHLVDRAEFAADTRPLESTRWAAVVDSLGGRTLAHAIAQTRWGGTVTACGLADSTELPTTVLPFILRAVRLIGINSVDAPVALRERAWALLAAELDPAALDNLTSEIGLDEVIQAGADLLANARHGRTVVRVGAGA